MGKLCKGDTSLDIEDLVTGPSAAAAAAAAGAGAGAGAAGGSAGSADAASAAAKNIIPAVACPVHSFVFDLRTGHCLTNHTHVPSGPVYATRVLEPLGVVFLAREATPQADNQVSLEDGQSTQRAIVKAAIDRKFARDGDDMVVYLE
eukprot:g1804.t1